MPLRVQPSVGRPRHPSDAAPLDKVFGVEPLLTKTIFTWTENDVEALVAAKMPEGMRVDYKSELPITSRKHRIEICKDVSGLANAQGGWLFYGIAEDDSPEPLPVEVCPFEVGGALTVFEDILDSSLQPRARFEARPIDVDGGQVVLVRVEPRQGALVMIQGYGEFRYYRRSGTRTIPMDQQEVAVARAHDDRREGEVQELLSWPAPVCSRVGRFRDQKLDAARLREEHGLKLSWEPEWKPLAIVLAVAMDAPRPLIHHSVFAQDDPFPELRDGLRADKRRILPLPAWRIDANGVVRLQTVNDVTEPPKIVHRFLVSRLGIIECARRYRQDDETVVPGLIFAEDAHDVLKYMGTIFASVGYFGRVATFIRIENAEHAQLAMRQSHVGRPREPGVEWIGHYADPTVDDLLVDPTPVVRDAMDVISQGFGLPRSPHFDAATGEWLGE